MNRFAENLRRIRFERHMTQEEFAALLRTTKQNVSRYESGAVSPKISTAQSIADKLGLTLAELSGDPVSLFGKRDEKTDTLNVDVWTARQDQIMRRRVPVLGDIAAGEPIVAERVYDEYVDIPDDGTHRYDAALRVTGDSMAPKYQIGDLVLVRYQDDVDDGQIAAVCLDDTVTLKRIYHMPNGLQLISDNPAYPPMVYTNMEVNNAHLVGLAVGVLHFDY